MLIPLSNLFLMLTLITLQRIIFYVQSSDFVVDLRSDMSLIALIITYSRPLLQATYEVILHPSTIFAKSFQRWRQSNPGPFDHELSASTARPGHYPCWSYVKY